VPPPCTHARRCREVVLASAKSWGSIDRAKRIVQRMEAERRQKEQEARAKVQGKQRYLQRCKFIATVVVLPVSHVVYTCSSSML
jgi:hypothetical protein